MKDEELEAIKERLKETDNRAASLGVYSQTTNDMRALIQEIEVLRRRQALLAAVVDAAVRLWSVGAGLLRTSLKDLHDRWPNWQSETSRRSGKKED